MLSVVTRRVAGHEPCGKKAVTCGQLWTCSGRRDEGWEIGGIYAQLGQRSVKAGMWCQQVVPSLCAKAIDSGRAGERWRPHELSTVGENLGKSAVGGFSGASGVACARRTEVGT